jgi:AAA+ ATPase superfamily predicted ATPase
LTTTAANNDQQVQLFIGREKELKQLFKNINSNNGSTTLLIRESDVGKSRLLDEFYSIIKFLENYHDLMLSQPKFFVGYYNKALIAESPLYPFNIALASYIQKRQRITKIPRKNRYYDKSTKKHLEYYRRRKRVG